MSAWDSYTSAMMEEHRANGRPTWTATMVRHSNLPEKRQAGMLVYSDISSPTQEGLDKSIKEMEDHWLNPGSYKCTTPKPPGTKVRICGKDYVVGEDYRLKEADL